MAEEIHSLNLLIVIHVGIGEFNEPYARHYATITKKQSFCIYLYHLYSYMLNYRMHKKKILLNNVIINIKLFPYFSEKQN